jgi:hypothetical protein
MCDRVFILCPRLIRLGNSPLTPQMPSTATRKSKVKSQKSFERQVFNRL